MSNGTEAQHNSWDGSYFITTRTAAKKACKAGIRPPAGQSVEVLTASPLPNLSPWKIYSFPPEGGAIGDIMDGFYDHNGSIPCQIDGGLKCFGHLLELRPADAL